MFSRKIILTSTAINCVLKQLNWTFNKFKRHVWWIRKSVALRRRDWLRKVQPMLLRWVEIPINRYISGILINNTRKGWWKCISGHVCVCVWPKFYSEQCITKNHSGELCTSHKYVFVGVLIFAYFECLQKAESWSPDQNCSSLLFWS